MLRKISEFFYRKALDMYVLAEYFNETPGYEYQRDLAESLADFFSDIASLFDRQNPPTKKAG